MVHALEGGYGTARLHPLIDWDALGDPRIVCGFSDLTALHLFIASARRLGQLLRPELPAIHAATEGRLSS